MAKFIVMTLLLSSSTSIVWAMFTDKKIIGVVSLFVWAATLAHCVFND